MYGQNMELERRAGLEASKAYQEITDLKSQLAEARKDTERLDWLERETGNAIYDTCSTTYKVTFRVGQGAFVSDCGSLRGAIDAARTEGKERG